MYSVLGHQLAEVYIGRYSAFGDVGYGQVEYLSEECAGGEGGVSRQAREGLRVFLR